MTEKKLRFVNYPQWLHPHSEHILYLYFRKYAISRPKVGRTMGKTLNALVLTCYGIVKTGRYSFLCSLNGVADHKPDYNRDGSYGSETVVMNSRSQMVAGLKLLMPKETRSRQ
jgi:hypothetical protein